MASAAWTKTGDKIFFTSTGGLSSLPEGKPSHAFSLTLLSGKHEKQNEG
jgi:hypothetical protein